MRHYHVESYMAEAPSSITRSEPRADRDEARLQLGQMLTVLRTDGYAISRGTLSGRGTRPSGYGTDDVIALRVVSCRGCLAASEQRHVHFWQGNERSGCSDSQELAETFVEDVAVAYRLQGKEIIARTVLGGQHCLARPSQGDPSEVIDFGWFPCIEACMRQGGRRSYAIEDQSRHPAAVAPRA